jgi:hypothetical protein
MDYIQTSKENPDKMLLVDGRNAPPEKWERKSQVLCIFRNIAVVFPIAKMDKRRVQAHIAAKGTAGQSHIVNAMLLCYAENRNNLI